MSLHAIGAQMFAGPVVAAGVAGAAPIVALEVAFTTNPGDTPVWQDVSDWLEEHTVNRGRGQENEQFRAGTIETVLANEDRRFDPAHTGSPYSPNVLPMRRVRLRATYEAVTYDVFTGYADGWQQEYRHPQVARCRLTATDAFKVLNQIELPSSVYAAEVRVDNPAHWYRLDEPMGSTTILDAVGTAHGTVTGAPGFGAAGLIDREPGTAVRVTNRDNRFLVPGASVPTGTAMTLEFWVRRDTNVFAGVFEHANYAGTATTLSVQITGGGDGLYVEVGGTVTSDTATNIAAGTRYHVAVVFEVGSPIKVYINGALDAATTVGTIAALPTPADWFIAQNSGLVGTGQQPDVTMDELALYSYALTPARIAAHYAGGTTPWTGDRSGARINRLLDVGGWPAADREIDAGVAVLQGADLGGSLLAALQAVEQTEQGRLFVTASGKVRFISREALLLEPYVTPEATFGDSGTELEYGDLKYRFDDGTVVNEAVVSRLDGVAQTVRDVASQTKYLRRSRVLTGLLHTTDATSIDLGNAIVNRYKEPFLRATQMRLEPDAGNAATHYPQVFGRELVDRVRVLRRPQSVGAAIDQDAYVEAITHRSRPLSWKTDFNLSPAPATSAAGIWDAGLWDSATWGF